VTSLDVDPVISDGILEGQQSLGNTDSPSAIFALCLASFTVVLGFGVIIPFLPLYADALLTDIIVGPVIISIGLQVGVMASAFMFSRFILAPAYGQLSDTQGRKPIILLGMVLYAFLMAGFGLAGDFISLLIVRLLQGVASAAVWPVAESLVVDLSSTKKTGRNLGWFMLSMQAGMVMGPFMGFVLSTGFTLIGLDEIAVYRFSFLGMALFGILSTIIVIFFVKEPNKHAESISSRVQSSAKAQITDTSGKYRE